MTEHPKHGRASESMAEHPILCDGPGPHDPPDGVVGTSDREGITGMRCASPSCQPTPPAPDADGVALIAAARADIQAATTIAQLRTRTLALDALRAQYPGVL